MHQYYLKLNKYKFKFVRYVLKITNVASTDYSIFKQFVIGRKV